MESIYSGISDVVNLWAVCRGGTRALGPGNRYVLWTQGCLHRCPGCVSPESRPFVPRLILSVDEIARDIISREDIDGVTVSGGEAFLQSEALTALFSAVKRERPDLSVIIFTGYTLEELTGEDDKALLSLTDVLIAGPLTGSEDLPTRGSYSLPPGFFPTRRNFFPESSSVRRSPLETER